MRSISLSFLLFPICKPAGARIAHLPVFGRPRFQQEYTHQEAQLMPERKVKRHAKADLIARRKSRDKARAAANAAKKEI